MATEWFLPSAFSHGSDAGRPSAYPHSKSSPWNPAAVGVSWTNPSDDQFFNDLLIQIAGTLQTAAVRKGLSATEAVLYPNYVVAQTPLKFLYGDNVGALAKISKKWDPWNLLSLTGGFLFANATYV